MTVSMEFYFRGVSVLLQPPGGQITYEDKINASSVNHWRLSKDADVLKISISKAIKSQESVAKLIVILPSLSYSVSQGNLRTDVSDTSFSRGEHFT